MEFEVDDYIFLKITHLKGITRFGKKEKLNPHFIGPFEILERIKLSTYRVVLPPEMSKVDNVFHVSMLWKYNSDPSHGLSYNPLSFKDDLSYEQIPKGILDQKDEVLRNRTIPFVKVLWQNDIEDEATWELE